VERDSGLSEIGVEESVEETTNSAILQNVLVDQWPWKFTNRGTELPRQHTKERGMDTIKALEAAQCARINLSNMVKMMPILKENLFLGIVEAQIDECIKSLMDDEVAP